MKKICRNNKLRNLGAPSCGEISLKGSYWRMFFPSHEPLRSQGASIHLTTHPHIHPSMHPYLHTFIHLCFYNSSTYPPTHLPILPPTYQRSIHIRINLLTYSFTELFMLWLGSCLEGGPREQLWMLRNLSGRFSLQFLLRGSRQVEKVSCYTWPLS